MSLKRPTRFAVAVAVAWTCVVVGLFLYFFGRADTDDYAGWLVVVYFLQVFSFVAMTMAPRDEPLGMGRATAIALPAALAVMFATSWLVIIAGMRLWPTDGLLNVPRLALLLAVGIVILLAALIWSLRSLQRRGHPSCVTRVLWLVTVAGVVGMIAMSSLRQDAGRWIAGMAPLVFVAPLWIVRTSHPAIKAVVPTAKMLSDSA